MALKKFKQKTQKILGEYSKGKVRLRFTQYYDKGQDTSWIFREFPSLGDMVNRLRDTECMRYFRSRPYTPNNPKDMTRAEILFSEVVDHMALEAAENLVKNRRRVVACTVCIDGLSDEYEFSSLDVRHMLKLAEQVKRLEPDAQVGASTSLQ